MKLALIGNYKPDRQQSMLRFESMLAEALTQRGHTLVRHAPEPHRISQWLRRWLGRSENDKWLAYFDKYLAFRPSRPGVLPATVDLVHVVDHSNAVYLPSSPAVPWVVTCHDLLAVRGALGEDTDCPASALGRRLQSAIQSGLSRAQAIACDSSSTRTDLDRIVAAPPPQLRRTILLGLAHAYQPISRPLASSRLKSLGLPLESEPFLLHVGSNLTRKNKLGIFRVFARLADRWPGRLVFVGADLPDEVATAATQAGLSERVHAVPQVTNAELEAFYALAHSLIFPSTCEGFGWPVVEAQACGCPVICSDRTSLPEIAGAGACVFPLADEVGMAEAVLRLGNPVIRKTHIQAGTRNVARFKTERMIDDYCTLYQDVIARFRRPAPAPSS